MKKTALVLAFIILSSTRSIGATHTVTYNVTTSVTCAIGDTLKLYGTFAGDYVAALLSGTTTVSNIFPTIVSSAPYYIGYFVITGTETSFFFAEITQGPTTGSIVISTITNMRDQPGTGTAQIFPNPFETNLQISSLTESTSQLAYFSIVDLQGAVLYEGKIAPALNSRQIIEPPASLKNGHYFLLLYTTEKVKVAHAAIIKQL